jgi:hypothetical protein
VVVGLGYGVGVGVVVVMVIRGGKVVVMGGCGYGEG